MQELKNRLFTLKSRPQTGLLDPAIFELCEENIRALKDGEFLVKNSMLSFDPTQRFWMEKDTYVPKIPLGATMRASGVGKIIQSKNPSFPEGTRVAGLLDWQDYAICDTQSFVIPTKIPDFISDEAALSLFGMTGMTGYFGMIDIGKPKESQTVLVSGAAGATGSIAAQVAKNLGARVIGIAGGDHKCEWLTKVAKLDAVINYKTTKISSALQELAPHGVDVYFDNVGGEILDAALAHLAYKARVVLCGAIATYDGVNTGAIKNYLNLVLQRAKMEGFLVFDYADRYSEAMQALAQWQQAGTMHYEVDVQHGLEKAPQTLARLFAGQNLGKQLLKL